MEVFASADGEVLLVKMRALARRGARLRREPDGAGLIEQPQGRRYAQHIAPGEFLAMLDNGWLRSSGADQFVMSQRGVSALRRMLSAPATAVHPASSRAAVPPAAAPRPPTPVRPMINDKESPLAWLRQRRDKDGKPMISATAFEAGERLRADFERAQMTPRVTSSWNPAATSSGTARGAPGAGLETAESVVAAHQRVEAALKAVGPELSGLLLDVCCFLHGLEDAERNRGWPRRAGKVVLQLALAHLARHYGLDREAGAAVGRVRRWGASDYRPAVAIAQRDEDGSETE